MNDLNRLVKVEGGRNPLYINPADVSSVWSVMGTFSHTTTIEMKNGTKHRVENRTAAEVLAALGGHR